ncbi:MAG TPA: hypothetical protein VK171_08460 [Fimbriimonas sp.]|nr:hypothetical protein [Fimbriimonas sp.]
MIDSDLSLEQFVSQNKGAALVFPSGLPSSISAPQWSSDGEDEMSCCQREFFQKFSNDVSDIPMSAILFSWDCIDFLDGIEAAPWLPVWMCGATYAVEVINQSDHCVTLWAQFALEKCIEADKVTVPMEGVEYFVATACDSEESESELYSKLETLRQRQLS